jgi:hypothetical protein
VHEMTKAAIQAKMVERLVTPRRWALVSLAAAVVNVNRTAKNFWVGPRDEGGGAIRVRRFPSEAEAAQAVKDAVEIDAAAAGRYAVLGPFKAAGAKEDLATVADCLKNG